MQKQKTLLKHNVQSTEDDIQKLFKLVSSKKEKASVITKDMTNLRREVKQLERECDEFNKCRESIASEVKAEQELIE